MMALLLSLNSFQALYPIYCFFSVGVVFFSSLVPQGSVLLPLLFHLFMNNLDTCASVVHSFADYSTLHKSSSFHSWLFSIVHSQSQLATSSTIS